MINGVSEVAIFYLGENNNANSKWYEEGGRKGGTKTENRIEEKRIKNRRNAKYRKPRSKSEVKNR